MSTESKSSTPTDSEIVFGILNNSENAIKRLYVAYFPMVMQLILNNNVTPDDAKDIYQEAIIVLYNKIKKGDLHCLEDNISQTILNFKPSVKQRNTCEYYQYLLTRGLFYFYNGDRKNLERYIKKIETFENYHGKWLSDVDGLIWKQLNRESLLLKIRICRFLSTKIDDDKYYNTGDTYFKFLKNLFYCFHPV